MYTEYYNYTNNNYNQPLYENTTKLYDSYQGFIRGNMFVDLYNDYKIKPIELKPLNDQAKLLTSIDSLEFAMKDINLYLDIYPEDKNMIGLYNQYKNNYNTLQREYEEKYGPLDLNSDVLNNYPFCWIDNPWPWMGGK